MCKTKSGKLDEMRREIAQIRNIKLVTGISYNKCQELNKRVDYLSNKSKFYEYMLKRCN